MQEYPDMKLVTFLSLFFAVTTFAQGPLTSSGPPAPSMKTLDQIEPRTPIGSLPFAINTPGSYYFTTNLSGHGAVITINTNNVVLDLNGFTLGSTGPATGGQGIVVMSARDNIVVRNGMLRNLGWAINAFSASSSSFERLHVTGNSVGGIGVGDNCQIIDSIIVGNTNAGILAGQNCTISGCQVNANTQGIRAGSNCQIINSTASGNTNLGIGVGDHSTISRCETVGNGGDGLQVGAGGRIVECTSAQNRGHGVFLARTGSAVYASLIKNNFLSGISSELASPEVPNSGVYILEDCVVRDNLRHGIHLTFCCNTVTGCSVMGNGWDGIRIDNRSHVSGNLAHLNGTATNNGAGIRLTSTESRVEDNTINGNAVGIAADGGANFIIRNHAVANGTNYHNVGAQNAGPIIGPGAITTNNPWANFSY
jgi:hypothetical protein